jgi:PST family polysaccharide transporter
MYINKLLPKSIIDNFSALLSIQVINYLIPIITVPYLTRVIGPEKYGMIDFVYAIFQYFIILNDFGFAISGTRNISINRDNKEKISEIISLVLIIKIILMTISLVILFVLIKYIPSLQNYKLLFFYTGIYYISQVFYFTWYFQGIEKVKYIAIINAFVRIFFTALIFIVIREEKDYYLMPLVNGIGALITTIITLYIIFVKYNIKLKIVNMKMVYSFFKESMYFFLSRAAVTIYTTTNSVIIGSKLGMADVGYYNFANKIVNLARTPFELLNTAVYPYMVKNKDKILISKIIKIGFTIAMLAYSVVFLFSRNIVTLFGGIKFIPSAPVLKLLFLNIPIISIHYFLGNCVLVVFGYDKKFNNSIIYASLLYIIAIGMINLFYHINLLTISILVVMVDMFIMLYRYFYVTKYRILTSYEKN